MMLFAVAIAYSIFENSIAVFVALKYSLAPPNRQLVNYANCINYLITLSLSFAFDSSTEYS